MEVLILIHTRTNKFNDNPLIPEGLIMSIPYHNANMNTLNTFLCFPLLYILYNEQPYGTFHS